MVSATIWSLLDEYNKETKAKAHPENMDESIRDTNSNTVKNQFFNIVLGAPQKTRLISEVLEDPNTGQGNICYRNFTAKL